MRRCTSRSLNSKSNTAKFSRMCSIVLDLGIITTPRTASRCTRIIKCKILFENFCRKFTLLNSKSNNDLGRCNFPRLGDTGNMRIRERAHFEGPGSQWWVANHPYPIFPKQLQQVFSCVTHKVSFNKTKFSSTKHAILTYIYVYVYVKVKEATSWVVRHELEKQLELVLHGDWLDVFRCSAATI